MNDGLELFLILCGFFLSPFVLYFAVTRLLPEDEQ